MKTIQNHPEFGLIGSIYGMINGPFLIIQYLSLILGLFVAFITLIVKIMEIRKNLEEAYYQNNISIIGFFVLKGFRNLDYLVEKLINFFRKKNGP